MKNDKYLFQMGFSFLFLFYGSLLLLSSHIPLLSLKMMLSIFLGFYGVSHVISFFLLKKEKDYTYLLQGITGILCLLVLSFFPIFETLRSFSISLLCFSGILSFCQLKRADTYHDKKSNFWYIEIAFLLLFLFFSVLVSCNLNHEESVLMLIFGFYIYFIGTLEFFEAFFLNLTRGKLK